MRIHTPKDKSVDPCSTATATGALLETSTITADPWNSDTNGPSRLARRRQQQLLTTGLSLGVNDNTFVVHSNG